MTEMVNRMYQSLIHQMREAVGRTCGVVDNSGAVVACSELSMNGADFSEKIRNSSQNDVFTADGYTLKIFPSASMLDNYAFVEGEDTQSAVSAGILAVAFDELKHYFDDKFDIVNFVKNLLFDNILPGELYAKCKDLAVDYEAPREVMLIRTSNDSDVSATELLSQFFPDKTKTFIVNINDTDTVVVLETKAQMDELEKIAASIHDMMCSEYYSKCYVGLGSVTSCIKDIPKSYKEAQLALEVGRVFDNESHIISYENLGIGRLIFQLPRTLCEMFINEVFADGSIHMLDNETLLTIQKFFENNLNVSETARKLFVHRNTLVYRLEKIKKITGLDIREFDNAITFKVAIMVNQYLSSKNENI